MITKPTKVTLVLKSPTAVELRALSPLFFSSAIHIHLPFTGFEYKDYKGMNDNVGWCRSLMMLLLAILLVSVGSGISLLFIYTGGNLDQRSIERALPILQQDVENTMIQIGQKVDHGWHDAQKTLNPILKKVLR